MCLDFTDGCLDIAVKNTENYTMACLLQGQNYQNFSQKMSREILSEGWCWCSGKRCCRNTDRSRDQTIDCMDRVARIISGGQFVKVWFSFSSCYIGSGRWHSHRHCSLVAFSCPQFVHLTRQVYFWNISSFGKKGNLEDWNRILGQLPIYFYKTVGNIF